MSLDDFPRCPGCNRISQGWLSYRINNGKCPLGDACTAPPKCHARIGIGVATLGSDCDYPEGHQGNHIYGYDCCNKHPQASGGCPK